jgi:HAD superfamily hydrolase (TIGR01490 family)
MDKRKFAAFDIDGTIGRTSLFLDVIHELIDTGKISTNLNESLALKKEEYLIRTHNRAYKDYSGLSVKILLENMENILVSDYKKAVDTVVARKKNYLYVYTRDLIKKLKSEGYFLIALSGSEMYTVQEFTKQFNFDIAVGEYYHEKNGKFTGKIDEVFHRKHVFVKQIAKDNNLTFDGSIAVGDSMGDLEMLEVVENPIVFNPEDRLYEQAKIRGWKIVVERKNVIYELEPNNGKYILA